MDRLETWIVLMLALASWMLCDCAFHIIPHYIVLHFGITMESKTTAVSIRLVQMLVMLSIGYVLFVSFLDSL
jgi:hypothetical protein